MGDGQGAWQCWGLPMGLPLGESRAGQGVPVMVGSLRAAPWHREASGRSNPPAAGPTCPWALGPGPCVHTSALNRPLSSAAGWG